MERRLRRAGFFILAALAPGCFLTLDFDRASSEWAARDAHDAPSEAADESPHARCATPEVEPNDSVGQAQAIEVGASVCGAVSPSDPRDSFLVMRTGDGFDLVFDVDRRVGFEAESGGKVQTGYIDPKAGLPNDAGSNVAGGNRLFDDDASSGPLFITVIAQDASSRYTITRFK
jgi:hypothetical protein